MIAPDSGSSGIGLRSSPDGVTWTAVHPSRPQNARARALAGTEPELAVGYDLCRGNGELVMLFEIAYPMLSASSDGSHWTAWSVIDAKNLRSPNLAFFASQTYIACTDGDGNVMVLTSPDPRSGHWDSIDLGGKYTSKQRVILSVVGPLLVLGFVDTGGMLKLLSSHDGQEWCPESVAPPIAVPQDFAMCGFRGRGDEVEKLYVVFLDGAGLVRVRMWPGERSTRSRNDVGHLAMVTVGTCQRF